MDDYSLGSLRLNLTCNVGSQAARYDLSTDPKPSTQKTCIEFVQKFLLAQSLLKWL